MGEAGETPGKALERDVSRAEAAGGWGCFGELHMPLEFLGFSRQMFPTSIP